MILWRGVAIPFQHLREGEDINFLGLTDSSPYFLTRTESKMLEEQVDPAWRTLREMIKVVVILK